MQTQHHRIAHHEAAHALWAWQVRHTIVRVTVSPTAGETLLHVPLSRDRLREHYRESPTKTTRLLKQIAGGLWAGPLAEGAPPCGHDARQLAVWRQAWSTVGAAVPWHGIERQAVAAVAAWVRRKGTHQCLDWLAGQLMAHRTVSREQWDRLIQRYTGLPALPPHMD